MDIPVRWMLSASSPADLARRIEDWMGRGEDADQSMEFDALPPLGLDVLLTIRPGGGGPPAPLFCVHPASGLSWAYHTLGRHLASGRPVYGLQAPQIGGGERRSHNDFRTRPPVLRRDADRAAAWAVPPDGGGRWAARSPTRWLPRSARQARR